MAELYDIKAIDIDDKLCFKVQYDIGQRPRIVPANMDFFVEASISERERFIEQLPTYDWSVGMSVEDRGWIDTEGNALVSIKYISLGQKSLFMQTFDDVVFYNADISEEALWMRHFGHTMANFMAKPLKFDIEVDPTDINTKMESSVDAIKYSNRVLMFGCADDFGNVYPIIEDDERKLLKTAFAVATKYSSLVGWNSGGYKKSFDIPYLQGRSKVLGLKLPWKEVPHQDLMHVYKNYKKIQKDLGEVVHLGLDDVAEKYLGYGKTERAYHKLVDWFLNDKMALETYCMNDVLLLNDLCKKIPALMDGMNVEVVKRKLAYLRPNEHYVSSFVDSKFIEFAMQQKLATPKQKEWIHRDPGKVCPFCDYLHKGDFGVEVCAGCGADIKKTGAGGLVLAPKPGLTFNTIFIDYYSLYPTIYITHNIGVNTVDWSGKAEDTIKTEELSFFKNPRGLNATFMDWLLTDRKRYRDERDKYVKGTDEYLYYDMYQAALKDILVSANGVLEQKNFRYKNQKIYNSCTKTGQIYLQLLLEAATELGLELVQADTDGIHLLSPYGTVEETVEHLKEIEEHLYNRVKEKALARWNIPEEYYVVYPRCEKICSHFFSIAKKSYVMKIVYDDGKWVERFDAKGMPAVKYNTLPLLKEILKNIFKEVIFKLPPGADYVDACVNYLLALKDDLYSGRRDDLLTFSQTVDKLGGRNPWDRAATKLYEMGKFEPGMIIRYIRRKNGQVILPDYEACNIDLNTYNVYWTGAAGSWVKRLLPDVAGIKELGFEEAMENDTGIWV